MMCQHLSVRFALGGFHIYCDLCNQEWTATKTGGIPDHAQSKGKLGESDHRIKPSESSSKHPKIVLASAPAPDVKPSDSTRILRADP